MMMMIMMMMMIIIIKFQFFTKHTATTKTKSLVLFIYHLPTKNINTPYGKKSVVFKWEFDRPI